MISSPLQLPDRKIENKENVVASVLLAVPPVRKVSLLNRDMDFWFLGGLSFVVWMLVQVASRFSNLNSSFDRQIDNLPFLFSALSLVCNYPHFIFSYRLAYGDGFQKIRTHWFALILVPVLSGLLVLAAFFASFTNFSTPLWILGLSNQWPTLPVLNNLARSTDIGSDLLRFGAWTMWALTGWHYSKQIFGIMLRYAKFDSYEVSNGQKQILRFCLLAVVPARFIDMSLYTHGQPGSIQDLSMNYIQFPHWMLSTCSITCILFVITFIASLALNYVQNKQLPSVNFLTPFVAFYLWWFPGFWPQQYSLMMVPFFHSLQYLPFSYKRLEENLSMRKKPIFGLTTNVIFILIMGYLALEFLPSWLDDKMHMRFEFGSSFFIIAIAIFTNIHHFFIDSVIWKSEKSAQKPKQILH